MTKTTTAINICNKLCPRVDLLLEDYDKCSDTDSDYDSEDETSSYDETDTENQDSDDEESDDDESTYKGRRNICSAMMEMLAVFPADGKKQGVLEYNPAAAKKPAAETVGGGGIVYAIQTTLPTQTFQDEDKRDHPLAETNPTDVLNEILESKGIATTPVSYKSLPADFFLNVTDDMVAAYNIVVMSAIRRNDLGAIKRMHKAGQNMQCCNAFGESLVHTVARRGYAEMLEFLIRQVGVSLRIKCDSGRTVLHDACWNASPNFDCMRLILEECPDLLLVSDDRNHTPLSYAPKDSWGEWCTFLKENPDLVAPKEIVSN